MTTRATMHARSSTYAPRQCAWLIGGRKRCTRIIEHPRTPKQRTCEDHQAAWADTPREKREMMLTAAGWV